MEKRRRPTPAVDQPALPLDVGGTAPATPRAPRRRSHAKGEGPAQLTLGIETEEEIEDRPSADEGQAPEMNDDQGRAPVVDTRQPSVENPPLTVAEADPSEWEPEPPALDPDPFVGIPDSMPTRAAGEFVLLPASLRGRLDLRELTRFLATLPTVVRDWDGAPEVDDGGVRLRGSQGGAWIYPEARRVRLITDGVLKGPVGEDLTALCRWLDTRAGMRLYPAGESSGAGADRSIDPWETFLGG